jgi:hypothetical protein
MTPIDMMLNGVQWEASPKQEQTDPDMPYATHSGILEISGFKLRCYRLNDGRAVFEAGDLTEFFNALTDGHPMGSSPDSGI